MSYTLISPQPGARSSELSFDDVGPGLYPGEIAVELDDGNFVAVSVDKKWLENGSGMSFKGCARWIEADGTTNLTDAEQHIETFANYNADQLLISTLTISVIAKELLLAVLGEDPTLHTVGEGQEAEVVPIIMWSPEYRLNASIKNALALAGESGPSTMDVAALLGL